MQVPVTDQKNQGRNEQISYVTNERCVTVKQGMTLVVIWLEDD